MEIENSSNYSEESLLKYPFYLRTIGTVICTILLIVGCLGNTSVPIVVARNRDLRNSTNIFLINLSISDLLLIIFCTPTVIVELNTKPEVWILGDLLCKTSSFVEIFVAHGSILTILAISFERYYAICRPLEAGYRCTRRRAVFVIFAIWIVSLLTTLPVNWITYLETVEYIDGSQVTACLNFLKEDWHPYYYLLSFVLLFCIPFLVLVFLFSQIHSKLNSPPKSTMVSHSTVRRRLKTRRQVLVMLTSVCAVFFLCLLPYRLMIIWIIISPIQTIKELGMEPYYCLLYFCRTLLYLNSTLNPIIYNIVSSKFRRGWLKVFGLEQFLKNSLKNSRNHSLGISSNEYRSEKHSTSIEDPKLDCSIFRSSYTETYWNNV